MKIQSKLMLTAAALAALTAASSGVANARGFSWSGSVSVSVGGRAPSPRVENPGRAPYRGATWVSGYWSQQGRRYVWVAGHWERQRPAPQPVYTPPAPSYPVYVPPPPGTPSTPPVVISYPTPVRPQRPRFEEYLGARRTLVKVPAQVAAGLPSALPETQQPVVFIWTADDRLFHIMAVSRSGETRFQGRISTTGAGTIDVARRLGEGPDTDRIKVRPDAIAFDFLTTGADGFEFSPSEGDCVNIDLRADAYGRLPTIMMGVKNVTPPTGNLQVCR